MYYNYLIEVLPLQGDGDVQAKSKKREMRAVKEICDIILAGLERFPAKERKARLDRMHVILTGADQRPPSSFF